MRIFLPLLIILMTALMSCTKEGLVWNLPRTSPNDAKLEVSEIIYSNNCSDLTGFTLNAWGNPWAGAQFQWVLSNEGITGNCIQAQMINGTSVSKVDSATVEINTIIDTDCVLRLYIKDKIYGMPIDGVFTGIKINNRSINTELISKKYDKKSDYYQAENWKKDWHQIQTGVIRKENNSIKITFPREVLIDNIELWVPIY